jgi:hypothetical protein
LFVGEEHYENTNQGQFIDRKHGANKPEIDRSSLQTSFFKRFSEPTKLPATYLIWTYRRTRKCLFEEVNPST